MACEYDELQIGSIVNFEGIICTACWQDTYAHMKAEYIGHINKPSGRKAVFRLLEPIKCSHCDKLFTALSFDCEDNNGLMIQLFTSIEESIEI